MKTVLILLLSVCSFAHICANSTSELGRIAGGSATTIDKAPYMAAIKKNEEKRCTAFIISNKHLVTAASCIEECSSSFLSGIDCTVIMGATNFKDDGISRKIRTITKHPHYDADSLNFNVALVTLCTELVFNTKIQAITFPEATGLVVEDDSLVNIYGWGQFIAGAYPTSLRAARLQITNHDVCNRRYQNMNLNVKNTMYCADANDKEVCLGDIGGPLVYFDKLNGKNVAIGVISRTNNLCKDPIYPVLALNLKDIHGWLISETNEHCMSLHCFNNCLLPTND